MVDDGTGRKYSFLILGALRTTNVCFGSVVDDLLVDDGAGRKYFYLTLGALRTTDVYFWSVVDDIWSTMEQWVSICVQF